MTHYYKFRGWTRNHDQKLWDKINEKDILMLNSDHSLLTILQNIQFRIRIKQPFGIWNMYKMVCHKYTRWVNFVLDFFYFVSAEISVDVFYTVFLSFEFRVFGSDQTRAVCDNMAPLLFQLLSGLNIFSRFSKIFVFATLYLRLEAS